MIDIQMNSDSGWSVLDSSLTNGTVFGYLTKDCFIVTRLRTLRTSKSVEEILQSLITKLSDSTKLNKFSEGSFCYKESIWYFNLYKIGSAKQGYKAFCYSMQGEHCVVLESSIEDLASLQAYYCATLKLIAGLPLQELCSECGVLSCVNKSVYVKADSDFIINTNSNEQSLLFMSEDGFAVITVSDKQEDSFLPEQAINQLKKVGCQIVKSNKEDGVLRGEYLVMAEDNVTGYLVAETICVDGVYVSGMMYDSNKLIDSSLNEIFSCEVITNESKASLS